MSYDYTGYSGQQQQQQQYAYGQGQQHPPPQQQGYAQQQQGGYAQQQQGHTQPPQFQPPPAPPASQHYGDYGQQLQQNAFQANAWQAMGMQSEDSFYHAFEMFKSRRFQALQAEELMKLLNNHPEIQSYYRIQWGMEICKIMIAMLDRSKDGMLQYNEFRELLQCLTCWHKAFVQYDHDRSSFIEAKELGSLITSKFGYQLTAKALECLLKRYSRVMDDGRCLISFEDFVAVSVRLRAYTEAFRARDRSAHNGQETGTYPFGYDDFIQCVMCL